MRFTRCFATCAISLVLSVGIPASSSSDIPSEKEQAIRKLMEMISADDLGGQVGQQLLSQMRLSFPQAPESVWSLFAVSLVPT
jgi:hypothetical protein